MLDLIFYYGVIGFTLSIFMNILLWAMHRPVLGALETLACILLWPTVISSFINTMSGVEEDIEE